MIEDCKCDSLNDSRMLTRMSGALTDSSRKLYRKSNSRSSSSFPMYELMGTPLSRSKANDRIELSTMHICSLSRSRMMSKSLM